MFDISFYKGKRVLVTGHTGFKGSWMCQVLKMAGAEVAGYALKSPTNPSLFEICNVGDGMLSFIGDICDLNHMLTVFHEFQPEIVIHMAAQPIVRESYKDPVGTYRTNVMGTVNVLECIKQILSVKSFVNVTTDKVYKNREWEWGYRENEELNGYDPYSNSKSCSELVTESYKKSFFADGRVAVSTCRAGNVIGGGDFAADRIIPDCIRAVQTGRDIIVRNPYSTRPYQYVLEPVAGYLMVAAAQYEDIRFADSYNIGPDESDCWSTGDLVTLFCDIWNEKTGSNINWINKYDGGPHEANFLKLDCSKMKNTFGWKPTWNVKTALEKIVEWSVCWINGRDFCMCMEKEIKDFLKWLMAGDIGG